MMKNHSSVAPISEDFAHSMQPYQVDEMTALSGAGELPELGQASQIMSPTPVKILSSTPEP